MGRRKKSNYEKAYTHLVLHAEEARGWLNRHEAMEEWLAGVPVVVNPEKYPPESYDNFEANVIEPAREEILWRPIEEWAKKYKRIHVEAGRWRPIFDRMLDYVHRLIIESPELWAGIVRLWLESPMKAYRELAQLPGTPSTSWKTWATWWSMLRLGAFEWV